RDRVADVDRGVDRAERAIGRRADEVLGRWLASTRRLVAGESQEIAHGTANALVAGERCRAVESQCFERSRRRRDGRERLGKRRDERRDVQQRMWVDLERYLVHDGQSKVLRT